MCGLCGMFESGRRWLDAAATLDPMQVRRERWRRVALAREVLKPARISVDDWEGANFILRGPTGKTEIVDNLFDLWRAAERLGHRALDPLANVIATAAPERAHPTAAPAPRPRNAAPAEAPAPAQSRMPLHVLTGFLGSGKTTLLNRMLRDPALADSAVLINEIGAIAIDHHLVERVEEGDAIEMRVLKGGCLCCALRGDIADALHELMARRADGTAPPFSRIVLETTGLADPAPLLFTLAADPMLRHRFEPGVVVTTVDAVHGENQLHRHPEACKQVALADRIVITKTDVAAPAQSARIAALLRRMTHAVEFSDAQEAPSVAPLLAPIPPLGAAHPRDTDYNLSSGVPRIEQIDHAVVEHSADIETAAFSFDAALDWSAFSVWLSLLLHTHGDRVLRFKALIAVAGWTTPVALDAVHHLVHAPRHLGRWPDADRRSRLVFIVQGLRADRIEPSLRRFVPGLAHPPFDSMQNCRTAPDP